MAIDYEIISHEQYLFVKASGFDESLEEVMAYNRAVLEACLNDEHQKILSDERGLEYRLSTVDTYKLASAAAEVVPRPLQIAIVTEERNERDADFYQTVAVNRGVRVKFFCRWKMPSIGWIYRRVNALRKTLLGSNDHRPAKGRVSQNHHDSVSGWFRFSEEKL